MSINSFNYLFINMCLNPKHAARKRLRSIDTHSWNTQCHFPAKCNSYQIFIPYTPRSRVLLEKLTRSQLVQKFPAFCGTRRYMIAFTSAANCPCPEPVQSSPCPHPTSRRSILILSSHQSQGLPSGSFHQVSQTYIYRSNL